MKRFVITVACLLAACAVQKGFTDRECEVIASQSGAVMRLCRIGDRADSLFLRRKAAPLGAEELRSEYFRLLKQGMLLTVRDPADEGVGIAAPQVGVSRRLIAVQRFDKPGEPFECYVNPEIVGRSAARTAGREGCLSVPETSGTVLRADRIVLRYLDETTMRPVTDTVEGFTAVISSTKSTTSTGCCSSTGCSAGISPFRRGKRENPTEGFSAFPYANAKRLLRSR